MTTQDLYATVTNAIVAQLEAGNLTPWRCPWNREGGGLPLRHNGVAYRGVNVLWLFMTAAIKGYSSPYFMTFQQAKEFGGSVKKGEKSTPVLFCQPMTKDATAEDGKEGKESYWIARSYNVFSADQIDGLPDRYTVKPTHALDPAQRIEHADAFVKNTGADIRHGNGGAFYRPSEDYISLPPFEAFESAEAFYGTAAHELAHWSGAPHRLARDLKGYGNRQEYAREEIIAELASVFTCAALGIAPPELDQHAAYLQHWIAALKADSRYLFTAASKAQAACDFLQGLQPQP